MKFNMFVTLYTNPSSPKHIFSLLLTTQGDTREKDLREGYDVCMSEEWKVISDKLLVETVVMRILTFQSPSKLMQGDEIIDNLKVL